MKKLFALLLSLAMVMCMIPMETGVAFAEDSVNLSNYTLKVPDATVPYTGNEYSATVASGTSAISSNYGTISYSKKDSGDTYTAITGKPKDAGTYKATFATKTGYTYTGAVASNSSEFTISKLDLGSCEIKLKSGKTITVSNFKDAYNYPTNYFEVKSGNYTVNPSCYTLEKAYIHSDNKEYTTSDGAIAVRIRIKATTAEVQNGNLLTSANQEDFPWPNVISNSSSTYPRFEPKITTSFNYTGSAIEPEITWWYYSSYNNYIRVDLTKGHDYEVAYNNNTDEGTGSLTITGKGNYSGTLPLYFTISKKSIASSDVKITVPQVVRGSNGNVTMPEITVYDETEKKTLTQDVDYSYAWTATPVTGANITTAKIEHITVTGIKYSGSKVIEVRVIPIRYDLSTVLTRLTNVDLIKMLDNCRKFKTQNELMTNISNVYSGTDLINARTALEQYIEGIKEANTLLDVRTLEDNLADGLDALHTEEEKQFAVNKAFLDIMFDEMVATWKKDTATGKTKSYSADTQAIIDLALAAAKTDIADAEDLDDLANAGWGKDDLSVASIPTDAAAYLLYTVLTQDGYVPTESVVAALYEPATTTSLTALYNYYRALLDENYGIATNTNSVTVFDNPENGYMDYNDGATTALGIFTDCICNNTPAQQTIYYYNYLVSVIKDFPLKAQKEADVKYENLMMKIQALIDTPSTGVIADTIRYNAALSAFKEIALYNSNRDIYESGNIIERSKLEKYYTSSQIDAIYSSYRIIANYISTNLNECDDSIESIKYYATSDGIIPKLYIYDYNFERSRNLIIGKDYILTYKNSSGTDVEDIIEEGDYKVIAIGIGDYYGTLQFDIKVLSEEITDFSKKDFFEVIFSASRNDGQGVYYSHNSNESCIIYTDGSTIITPSINLYSIQYGRYRLNRSVDYSLVYYDENDNPVLTFKDYGTYRAVLTGKGKYTGSLTYIIKLVENTELNPGYGGNIENCEVNNIYRPQFATGDAVEPEYSIYQNGYGTLTKGIDYIASYTNLSGNPVEGIVESGNYKIIITGIGNYSGTLTLDYQLLDASENDISDISNYSASMSYSSSYSRVQLSTEGQRSCIFKKDILPIITPRIFLYFKINGNNQYSLTRGTDYTVSYYDSEGNAVGTIKDYGTYKAVVTGTGRYSGSFDYTINVVEYDSLNPGIDPGTEFAGYGIASGTDYDWTYSGYGNSYYNLDSDGTLRISGSGLFTAQKIYQASSTPKVKKIIVGKGINRINLYRYGSFKNLECYEVEPENEYYRAVDGILYSVDGKCLLHYPSAKLNETFTVPNGVVCFGNYSGSDYNTMRAYVDYANVFGRNRFLKTVTFTNCIEKWETDAFYNCSALENVYINTSKTALPRFQNCNSLKNVSLASTCNIEALSSWCFGNCSKLESVTLSNSLKVIGSYAFYNCTKLKNISLPDGLEKINSYAFYWCTSLQQIVIPDSVTYVGSSAFRYCRNLERVVWTAGDTTIRSYMFENDYKLAEVVIPDSVTAINRYAFAWCYNLSNIDLPRGLTYIGSNAFASDNISTVILPKSVSHLGSRAFSNNEINSLTIPNDSALTEILDYSFSNSEIEALTLPNSVRSLGYGAFFNNENLKTLNLGNVVEVGASAFDGCDAVDSITIPSSVTKLGEKSFYIDNATVSFAGGYPEMKQAFKYNTIIQVPCTAKNNDKIIESGGVTLPSHNYNGETCTNCGYKKGDIIQYSYVEEPNYWGNVVSNTNFYIPLNKSDSQFTCVNKREGFYDDGIWNSLGIKGLVCIGKSYPSEIVLPDSVNGEIIYSIDENAFSNAKGIKKLTVGKHIDYLGWMLDNIEDSLEEITMPITCWSYSYLPKLRAINLTPGSMEMDSFEMNGVISDYNDNNPIWYNNKHNNLTINIGEGIEKIPDNMFYNMDDNVTYTFPSTLKTIGRNAFYRNSKMKNIVLPSGLRTIDYDAFAECESLETCTIPSSVTTIRSNAFDGDDNLTLIVENDSYALSYARRYNIPYRIGSGEIQNPSIPADELNIKCLGAGCMNGETFAIPVYVESNPGIVGVGMTFEFDDDSFEFVGITNGEIFTTSPIYSTTTDSVTVTMDPGEGTSNITKTGKLFVLKLKAKNNCVTLAENAKQFELGCSISAMGRAINSNLEEVDTYMNSPIINVSYYKFGDANKDGIIDITDAQYLMRAISNWNGYNFEEGREYILDLNCDGKIGLDDAVILKRYLANWSNYKKLPVAM